jgi:hypothetical protein
VVGHLLRIPTRANSEKKPAVRHSIETGDPLGQIDGFVFQMISRFLGLRNWPARYDRLDFWRLLNRAMMYAIAASLTALNRRA